MARLRCFVAMAFEWPDTDAVFAAIRKAFNATIDIRRVDRIHHNKDIDKKIVEELDAADFVIADLTYARPSVYWEAGYAQGRRIPVVYTARRDHLGKNATDDNRRVHFDLQMRNIISWSTPDRTFLRKLGARVRLVTTPLLADRAAADARRTRCEEFAKLSQHKQLEAIADAVRSYFSSNDFVCAVTPHLALTSAIKMTGARLQLATVSVASSLTRTELRWVRPLKDIGYETNLNVARRQPRAIEAVHFAFSIGRVQSKTLRDKFPYASMDERGTLTQQPQIVFFPSASTWRTGQAIRVRHMGFDVGKRRVESNAKGTFEIVDWGERRRVGTSVQCRLLQRYRVISGITDPTELPQQIKETLDTDF